MAGRSRFTWRFAILALVLVGSTVAIIGRLAYIQILHHQRYWLEAQEEHLEKKLVRSERGAILDRNGFPLATSIDVFDVYVDRRAWSEDVTKAQKTAAGLAPNLGVDEETMLARLLAEGDGPIELLADGVDFAAGLEIQHLGLPGVTVAAATKRFHPEGDLASLLLGFLGRDHGGLSGLEADLESVLAGQPGVLYFERDGDGQPIAVGQTQEQPGTPGSDVRLTIDRYIQRLVEDELDARVAAHKASGGSIIVMDPKTGAILAMASRPSFKLSQLDLDNPQQDLYRNRAVTDAYEPGSVMKVITMATAIDLGLVNPNTTYYDSGTVQKGGYTFANWDFSANGVTTMTQLLQKSLNTGAIWLSDQIGPERLYESIERFGFGEPTHSGLGGESAGLLRTYEDPEWYASDLATNSYGQGIAATPLQVITAIASVINGGQLMRPYIVAEVDGPEERRVYNPVVVRQTISPATSETMVEMMRQVVDGVPGHLAHLKDYDTGGKTGTTLVSIPTGYALDSTIASFVGFSPVDDPAIIMLVKIDQPQDDPLGGIVAAPVYSKLAPKILAYLNVRPNDALAEARP
jgi:cell division protein FtsI/penicillin-binding protein 2